MKNKMDPRVPPYPLLCYITRLHRQNSLPKSPLFYVFFSPRLADWAFFYFSAAPLFTRSLQLIILLTLRSFNRQLSFVHIRHRQPRCMYDRLIPQSHQCRYYASRQVPLLTRSFIVLEYVA
ncbi:hypothetical protein FVEG_15668 [Fusarium verticillioides 7600]|uniref:Uncharacterized protein n=1 Tax=Gibberella moniliformis (strain M3125 / FGSC 7600) TaxID=334819 RepID=W7LYX5_GIBM7|nr:hypothetical protein FVEG_15668 [Fusarium verticillioides 7600]EWG44508.1 hypothetical protein FVEG_15668 [Fusarium verticillioides 7600]